jgi:hypothetical protein
MLHVPVINRSVHDARAQLQTGHQDIRIYFSKATVATTDHTATIPTVAIPARPNVPLLDIRHLLSVSVCRDRKSPKLATITAPVFGTETVTMNGTSLLLAQSPNELVVWLKRSRHESTPSETRVSTETTPTSPRESGTSNCGRSIIPGETLMESNRKLTYASFGEQSAVMRLTPMK